MVEHYVRVEVKSARIARGRILEIWLEVVDRRFCEARGVPSREGNRKIRRWRVGGKDTPLCSQYIKTSQSVKSSRSISTRLPELERGRCSPRHWRRRSKPISMRHLVNGTKTVTPWSFATGAPGSVRSSWEREQWRFGLRGSTTRGWMRMGSEGGSRA